MGNARTVRVDVRDMLCAQALAVVARAVEDAPAEASIEVLYDTDDVKRDLMIWAQERALTIRDDHTMRLQLFR